MPHYVIEVTVDTSDTEASPAESSTSIIQGIISEVRIDFMKSVNGHVRAILMLEGTQIYPNRAGSSYKLIVPPITLRDMFPTFKAENDISLRAWPVQAKYDHVISAYINVLPFGNKIRKVNID